MALPGRQAVTLRYREAGEGSVAMVLLHGAGTSSLLWLRSLGVVARVARVVAPDLPGHGRSGGAGEVSIAAYREAIRGLVRELGLEGPLLVGHSMGGAIALDYALAYPGEIGGLLLCSTAGALDVPTDLLDVLEHRPAAFPRLFARQIAGSRLTGVQAETAVRTLVTAATAVVRGDLLACAAFDLRERLAEVRVPTVVLTGASDTVTPPAAASALAAGIPGSQAILVEGAGHLLPWEDAPAVARAATALAVAVAVSRRAAP